MPTEHLDTPWYSFDYGVLHYIIISTEHAFAPQTPQYNFIVEVRDIVVSLVVVTRRTLHPSTAPTHHG